MNIPRGEGGSKGTMQIINRRKKNIFFAKKKEKAKTKVHKLIHKNNFDRAPQD